MLSLKNLTLHEKPYFHFPNVLKKWSFQKKSHWNMLFLVSSGKIIFLFPENMILLFRQKVKDNLSQKNRWKYNIFFKCSEKIFFPKKNHSGTWHFFFPNIRYFFRRKVKDDLSQKIRRNMMFSVYSVKMALLFPTNMKLPFCQKSKDDLLWKN